MKKKRWGVVAGWRNGTYEFGKVDANHARGYKLYISYSKVALSKDMDSNCKIRESTN